MESFGRRKFKKVFAEIEAKGIDTAGITDLARLYIALARARGVNVRPDFMPTNEEAGVALWYFRMRGEFQKLEGMEAEPMPEKPAPRLNSGRMSKRAMCDGKVAHRSAAAAQKAIDLCDYRKDYLNQYQCFYCGKFHVGHLIKP